MPRPISRSPIKDPVGALRRRGLTFIELMFATIILGVGMIIIASVFPVGISQQRQTLDEGSMNSLERGAIRVLEMSAAYKAPQTYTSPATSAWLPDTIADPVWPAPPVTVPPTPPDLDSGDVVSFANNKVLWDQISGNLVNAGDARYAFAPFYMRMREGAVPGPPPILDPFNDRVTFFVVTLTSKDTATFDGTTAATLNRLKPSNVKITYHFRQDGANPDLAVDPEQDTIKVEAGTAVAGTGTVNTPDAAVTGGFIIRSKHLRPGSSTTPNPLFPQNAIIRLGSEFEDDEINGAAPKPRIFRVSPGYELNYRDSHVLAGTSLVDGVDAYAIGADPTDTSKKANRAISCRGVTVTIKDPG